MVTFCIWSERFRTVGTCDLLRRCCCDQRNIERAICSEAQQNNLRTPDRFTVCRQHSQESTLCFLRVVPIPAERTPRLIPSSKFQVLAEISSGVGCCSASLV